MYNKPYLSIQELVEKTSAPRKTIEETMDSTAAYHPEEASLIEGLKAQDRFEVQEAIHNIPLREFLAKSGTTGIAGAAYLVPAKVHDELMTYSIADDLAPACSTMVNGWEGGSLLVDIAEVERQRYTPMISGGQMATNTIATKQATLTPETFGFSPRIASDLIEDAAFELISVHLKYASQLITRHSNELLCTTLGTATDGWGTLGSSVSGDANQTKYTGGATADVVTACRALGTNKFAPNTMITTYESWYHSISTTGAAGVLTGVERPSPPQAPFKLGLGTLDVAFSNVSSMHLAADVDGTFTDCVTLIFDRVNAALTGRKRWMKIENYADPIRDLAGSTITCRQGCITMHNNAIYKLYET
jgi:hypothetical protein